MSSCVQLTLFHSSSIPTPYFYYHHPVPSVATDLPALSPGFLMCSSHTVWESLKSYHPMSRILCLPRVCWPCPFLCLFLPERVFFPPHLLVPCSLYCAHLNTNPRLLFNNLHKKSKSHNILWMWRFYPHLSRMRIPGLRII